MLSTDTRALTGMLLANKYRLQKRLGSGGMGEVYRAVNESIGRTVAIKILRPELLRNEDVVQRFLREAKAATLVRHPNVVDVLDVLEHQDIPFMVQELLSGEDLADFVEARGARLALDDLLAVMVPVVDAVGAAHAKGVVHRDLKPANVFLHVNDGTVVPKVLDFGISKITTGDTSRVTTTGTALGTPAYMSPEQIEGLAHVDARSDVWSLGVMLFELAAGSRPFIADTPGALFVKIATTPAKSLADVCPDCPDELVQIVAKCLRADKTQRYADARALAAALRGLAEARAIPLKDRLLSLRPRVSLLDASPQPSPELVAPTLDENPEREMRSTREATPATQEAIDRVVSVRDVAARASDKPAARADHRPRWIAVALVLSIVATAIAVGSARPDDRRDATGERTVISQPDVQIAATPDAAVTALAPAQTALAEDDSATTAPDAQRTLFAEGSDADAPAHVAHGNSPRLVRRADRPDAARAEHPAPASTAPDAAATRVRGATTYE